jgi:hypothetical protein
MNGDILSGVRHEASRRLGDRTREYLEARINELATNSTSKNIQRLMKGYK